MKGKFIFRPPVAVKVVGSYLLKTAIKPDLNVDLALELPKVNIHQSHIMYMYIYYYVYSVVHIWDHNVLFIHCQGVTCTMYIHVMIIYMYVAVV